MPFAFEVESQYNNGLNLYTHRRTYGNLSAVMAMSALQTVEFCGPLPCVLVAPRVGKMRL